MESTPLRIVAPHIRLVEEPVPVTIEAAFRRYSAYVAQVALRLLGRDVEVDDTVQDVFVEAFGGIGRLREPAALKGWLATITVRVAQRKLRRRRLRAFVRLDDDPRYEGIAALGASPEQRALIAQIYRILDRLPAKERVAWTLRHVEGEPLEDVARLCRCSLATAKRRIAAAQNAIEEEAGDDA